MDRFSKDIRSMIMSSIKSKHTRPELALRKLLREMGYKYRLHYGKEKIDVALTSKKKAIFVDGCFWHKCPKHFHLPKTNKNYWFTKLERNLKRSVEKDKRLKTSGWKIFHIWEHEFEKYNVVNERLEKFLMTTHR